jgi:Cu+-exporting ATPase
MSPPTEAPARRDAETLGPGHHSLQLKIGGMSCSFCVSTIHKAASRLDGVVEASVNLAHEEALVRFDPERISHQAIVDAIRDVGYSVRDPRKVAGFEEREAQLRAELGRLRVSALVTAAGFALMVAMWAGAAEPIFPWMVLTLALIQVFVVGRNILAMAWPSLKRRILNQHVLLEFGALGGLLGGILGFATSTFSVPDFLGASLFITTYHLLSGYTSGYLRTRTSKAVAKLMALQPATARVVRHGTELEVPIEEVAVGDRVRVRPGEALPVDGRVVEGSSTVNEALVTGEPVPAEKRVGSEVIGGSINQAGTVVVEVTKVGKDSFLSQVTRYVEEARALKPGIIALNDAILAWFVPAVLVAGFGALIFWSVIPLATVGHTDAARGLFAMLAVAVMGYPCALGMATPLAMIRGGGRAAEKGILMRSGQAFQTFGQVRRVVLDKTGTLTAGKPSVTTIAPVEGVDRFELLRLAAGVEASSEHPLARAIVECALEAGLDLPDVAGFRSFAGNGVQGSVEGRWMVVGKPDFVAGTLSGPVPESFAAEAERAAQTVVWTAADGVLLGAVAITDAVRPDAAEAIAGLRRRGMEPYLVTGDNERVARAVAKVGIAEVRAGVLPDQKADLVRGLQADGTRVAMVGDGINDAPALMQADVGLAIGAGSDIAIESADVILIGERVCSVADAYDIATESYRKTKQNLAVALALNSMGVPAAASGYVNPIWAMVAMVASVTVVLSNSFGTNLPLTLWKGVKSLLLSELFSHHDNADGQPEPPEPEAVANRVTEQQPEPSPLEDIRWTYRVGGVQCDSCVERIEAGAGSMPGVRDVQACADGVVVVEGAVAPATVTETLDALGFPVEQVAAASPADESTRDGQAATGSFEQPIEGRS